MAGYPPNRGEAFSFDIPVFDKDGEYASGVTFAATELKKDAGAFAPLTNAPAETGSSGFYTISLTALEMDMVRASGRLVPLDTENIQSTGFEIFTVPVGTSVPIEMNASITENAAANIEMQIHVTENAIGGTVISTQITETPIAPIDMSVTLTENDAAATNMSVTLTENVSPTVVNVELIENP